MAQQRLNIFLPQLFPPERWLECTSARRSLTGIYALLCVMLLSSLPFLTFLPTVKGAEFIIWVRKQQLRRGGAMDLISALYGSLLLIP